VYLHGVNSGKFIHACIIFRNIFAFTEVVTRTGSFGIDLVGTDTRLNAGKPRDLVSIRGGKKIFSSVSLTKCLEPKQSPIQWVHRLFHLG
jgi:hypothetical protein